MSWAEGPVPPRRREEAGERLLRMTPLERLAEALALGDAAIEAYAVANGRVYDAAPDGSRFIAPIVPTDSASQIQILIN